MDNIYSQPPNRYSLINYRLKVFVEFELSKEGMEQAKLLKHEAPDLFAHIQAVKVLQLHPEDVEYGKIYLYGGNNE